MVRIYPEVELSVEIMEPTTKENIRVTGRADWGFGYSGRNGAAHGTFLGAMEAKQRDLFSTAEQQLLTYLTILRELRIRTRKTNTTTQGFCTLRIPILLHGHQCRRASWIIRALRFLESRRWENYLQFHRHYSGSCREMLSDRDTH